MTSSTKPEVHNLSQRRESRTKRLTRATSIEILVKPGHLVFEICSRTYRQTQTDDHRNTSHPKQTPQLIDGVDRKSAKSSRSKNHRLVDQVDRVESIFPLVVQQLSSHILVIVSLTTSGFCYARLSAKEQTMYCVRPLRFVVNTGLGQVSHCQCQAQPVVSA